MFIYRDSDDATIQLIEKLAQKAEAGEIDLKKVDESVARIENCLKMV